MATTSVVTTSVVTIPLSQPFLPKWLLGFADNQYQNITERTFRNFASDIDATFVAADKLTTNMVRGATFRVPYVTLVAGVPTVDINQVPARLRIQGMEIMAVNGVPATEAAAGVKADPIFFRLLAYPTGAVDALVDEQASTTATVKCRLVRTSGTEAQQQAGFELLQLEDKSYLKAEVVKWVFDNGATRLLEWRANSVGQYNPEPTGRDDDPIYAPYALPTASAVGLSAVQAQQLDDALPAPMAADGRTVSERLVLDVVTKLKQGRGFVGPNTGSSDRNYWEGNWELRAYNGADANYFAFVQSSKYAAMRRDAVDARIAEAIAAIPAYTEIGVDFPAQGAQSREVRIKDQRFVGKVSVLTVTGGMANLSFKLNGTVVALPVAVALGDVLTVSGSMPTGGGVVTLNIS